MTYIDIPSLTANQKWPRVELKSEEAVRHLPERADFIPNSTRGFSYPEGRVAILTTEQFATNSTKCGLKPVFGGLAKPVMCWRGLDYYSAFDRHAYLHTTADGVTHATLRNDEPTSRLHGSITKPLEEVTDIDFIKILGMKQ